MQIVRTFFRVLFFFILNNLIKIKPLFSAFNYVFERSPYFVIFYLTRHVVIPNKNLNWKIKLYNNRIVKTKILKNNPKTWHFALSYKWHDRGLNMLETILTDYYSINAIWIDCGANLGLRSITALSKNIPVYMIEPNEETRMICFERCKLNIFKNYKMFNYGVSNVDGTKTFYIDDSSYLSALSDKNLNSNNIKSINKIEVRKLDTIFKNIITSKMNVCIKIDIEGHELEALEGAEGLINSVYPTFIVEINEKGGHLDLIFNKMRTKGYLIYEINYLNKKSFLKFCLTEQLNYNSNDFLFVHNKGLNNFLKKYLV